MNPTVDRIKEFSLLVSRYPPPNSYSTLETALEILRIAKTNNSSQIKDFELRKAFARICLLEFLKVWSTPGILTIAPIELKESYELNEEFLRIMIQKTLDDL